MLPQEVPSIVRSQMGNKSWIESRIFEEILRQHQGKDGGLTSSAVVSTKIGSSWGSVDEGLVDAKSNA